MENYSSPGKNAWFGNLMIYLVMRPDNTHTSVFKQMEKAIFKNLGIHMYTYIYIPAIR